MYVGEWTPGKLEFLLAEKTAAAGPRNRSALAAVARAAETGVKTKLALTSHPYGQPTASAPGGPPSLVSGTLRRSITHTAVRLDAVGLFTNLGTGVGFYPSYPPAKHPRGGRHSRTPSSKYGLYLETGLRNGATYPFLAGTVREVYATQAAAIWRAYFTGY